MTPIERRVASLLRAGLEAGARERTLTADTPVRELGIGSLNLVRLLVALENAFDIEFDDEHVDLARFTTIGDLSRYIADQRQRAGLLDIAESAFEGTDSGEGP